MGWQAVQRAGLDAIASLLESAESGAASCGETRRRMEGFGVLVEVVVAALARAMLAVREQKPQKKRAELMSLTRATRAAGLDEAEGRGAAMGGVELEGMELEGAVGAGAEQVEQDEGEGGMHGVEIVRGESQLEGGHWHWHVTRPGMEQLEAGDSEARGSEGGSREAVCVSHGSEGKEVEGRVGATRMVLVGFRILRQLLGASANVTALLRHTFSPLPAIAMAIDAVDSDPESEALHWEIQEIGMGLWDVLYRSSRRLQVQVHWQGGPGDPGRANDRLNVTVPGPVDPRNGHVHLVQSFGAHVSEATAALQLLCANSHDADRSLPSDLQTQALENVCRMCEDVTRPDSAGAGSKPTLACLGQIVSFAFAAMEAQPENAELQAQCRRVLRLEAQGNGHVAGGARASASRGGLALRRILSDS